MREQNLSPRDIYISNLRNLSPEDGREVLFTYELRDYFSEDALHLYRAGIQVESMIALSESGFPGGPEINTQEKTAMRQLVTRDNFDSSIVADYDHFGRNGIGPLEHDVKAVEMTVREKMGEIGLGRLNEWVHFPHTSEDVNNLAWHLMLRDAINNVWLPHTLSVTDQLAELSTTYADVPVLGKTHGMNASPTTF